MATITPVAFYSGGTSIPGTTQVGNLNAGTSPQDYGVVGTTNGIVYYATPDQDLGYIIAHEDLTGGHNGRPGNVPAYLGFFRSTLKTTESFIELAEYISEQDNDPQTFTGGTDAKEWLNTNGYWTSYSEYIVSAGRTDTGGFQVGAPIDKDMSGPSNFSYPSGSVPNGSPNVSADSWSDWGQDIFDTWGFYYLYDPAQNNYLGLSFNTKNQANGVFSTQIFTFNGRTFTITQGYPVQGIFKFEIRCDDDQPFVFGEGGNMGSDSSTANVDQTYSYTLDGVNLTLWYNENYQTSNPNERFYSYFIPFLVDENSTKTYTDILQGSDNLFLYSVESSHGITVYHSKQFDVKQWVVYDLTFGN